MRAPSRSPAPCGARPSGGRRFRRIRVSGWGCAAFGGRTSPHGTAPRVPPSSGPLPRVSIAAASALGLGLLLVAIGGGAWAQEKRPLHRRGQRPPHHWGGGLGRTAPLRPRPGFGPGLDPGKGGRGGGAPAPGSRAWRPRCTRAGWSSRGRSRVVGGNRRPLTDLPVEEGGRFAAGDVLAAFDCALY